MAETIKFNYESIRTMPTFVRIFCMVFDGWLVGSAAKFVCSLSEDPPRDWDVIIPLRNWPQAVKIVPYQTKTNTFGGLKIDDPTGCLVDVWGRPRFLHLDDAKERGRARFGSASDANRFEAILGDA